MKIREFRSELRVYSSIHDLPAEWKKLLEEAEHARADAYAPYSKFKVGAAVLLENGHIIRGSNQENAAYPSGLCAERVAIFATGANYSNKIIRAIAVCASSASHLLNIPVPPCGACRQSLYEYEFKQKANIALILQGEEGDIYVSSSVADLLPFSFNGDFL